MPPFKPLMTTRNSDIETDNNQPSPQNTGVIINVLIARTYQAEKYHRQRAGTFTSCGRTNTDFELVARQDVPDDYEKCEKCFQGEGQ